LTLDFQNVIAVVAVCGFVALPVIGQSGEQVDRGQVVRDGRQWNYTVRKLPPASFPALPAALRQELERRQCMIPQTYQAKAPENIIAGEFSEKGVKGWAVLCSREGSSTLLVFGSDPIAAPFELATRKDAETTVPQVVVAGLGFAWGIDTAHPKRIRSFELNKDHYDHDGVEDAILTRGSSIHYCLQGKWTNLQGDN
jgi:hypothetical protein